MKTILFACCLCLGSLFLLAPATTLAQQNPGGTNSGTATVNLEPWYQNRDTRAFLAGILGYIQSIIAYLAVLFIVLGGVLYMLAATGAGSENMMKQAKSCWTAALIGIAIAAAAPSFLLQIVDVVGMPTSPTETRSLKEIVTRALGFLLSIAGSLAIIGLVVSGIMYMTAAGQKSQIDSAKRAMTYSIIGITVAGLALILVKQIIALITG